MKYKLLQILCFLLFAMVQGYAYTYTPASSCAAMKRSSQYAHKTTVADPQENNYDMKYVKFNLSFTDTSIYVSGDVSTTAQVVAATMGTYVFELDSAITVDSLFINGQAATVITNGIVRKVNLATALNQNDIFTAQVFYHGQPPTGTGFFTGITHSVTGTGVNMVYTLSDPYAGKDWWPCKQSLTDKIDSADIWITVPAGLKAGSNGLLQNISTPATGYQRYEWKTKYPIDYYLLSVSVAPYFDYSYYMHFTGSTDSMLIQNYL
jgi:aminopeptidase N